MLRNNSVLSKFFVTSGLLLLSLGIPLSAYASSGPVGLNGVRTDSGPGVGQVTLSWYRYSPNVDNYRIAYGTNTGKYQYSTNDVGNNVVETIGGLNPGQRYYFFISGFSQGQLLPSVSPEISEVAASVPQAVIESAGPFGKRALTAVTGPAKGQVTLTWRSVLPTTNDFSIVYGTQPGAYQYGALNVLNGGVTNGGLYTFTVGALNPGQRYYFAVVPMQGGQPLYSSGEVSQVAHW